MSDLKTLRGILKNLERVEDDIAAMSESTSKVVIDGHTINGDQRFIRCIALLCQ